MNRRRLLKSAVALPIAAVLSEKADADSAQAKKFPPRPAQEPRIRLRKKDGRVLIVRHDLKWQELPYCPKWSEWVCAVLRQRPHSAIIRRHFRLYGFDAQESENYINFVLQEAWTRGSPR